MAFKTILLEKKEGIAKITLNRPEVLNAMNPEMLSELEEAVADIERDDSVRAVIITGVGRAFSSGADLKAVKEVGDDPQQRFRFTRRWHEVFNAVENLSKPVIAAINGFCLAGGLELVEVCDLAIASDKAVIGDQHANYGLVAGGGGTQRLPRLIGVRKAKELLLTGDWLSPEEAERLGLVNKVVPADKLEETAQELAAKLAKKSPLASRTIKLLVNKGMQADLNTGLELEISAVIQHEGSEDVKEGIRAFEEKRTPEFPGR